MLLRGVSIQPLKANLTEFLQKKVHWNCSCNSTASLVMFNIAASERAHHKIIRAMRWNVFSGKPSLQFWAEGWDKISQSLAFPSLSSNESTVIACCTLHPWHKCNSVQCSKDTDVLEHCVSCFFSCAQRSTSWFEGQQWICGNLKINSTFSCDFKTENYFAQGHILLTIKIFLKDRIINKPCTATQ